MKKDNANWILARYIIDNGSNENHLLIHKRGPYTKYKTPYLRLGFDPSNSQGTAAPVLYILPMYLSVSLLNIQV
jgi:hypothetical protein